MRGDRRGDGERPGDRARRRRRNGSGRSLRHGPPPGGPARGAASARRLAWLLAGGLVLANLAIYVQTYRFTWLVFDDDVGLFKNPKMLGGLTPDSLGWAFRTTLLGNWIPLAWISHLIDFTLFGPNPGWHHLVNVSIHIANALLVFAICLRLSPRVLAMPPWHRRGAALTTGAVGASGLFAALFSLHPLRVESVAWLIERKDVLSAFFFLATVACYIGYAERRFSWRRYLAVVALFVLGLLAKPMLVSVPIVLLLLDFWPLGRVRLGGGAVDRASGASRGGPEGSLDPRRKGSAPEDGAKPTAGDRSGAEAPRSRSGVLATLGPLALEKLPFAAISALWCGIAVAAQSQSGAVTTLDQASVALRLENAAVSYAYYILKTIAPVGLSVYYPYRIPIPGAVVLGSALFLLIASAGCLRAAGRRPYLLVGWLWYLVTLVPVIGLVQLGAMAAADRYTYIPSLGLLAIAVLLPLDLLRPGGPSSATDRPAPEAEEPVRGTARKRGAREGAAGALGAAAGALVLALIVLSVRQASYWRDSTSLFERAILVTRENALAHYNLATAFAQKGRIDDAIAHYSEALRIKPELREAHHNLGLAYFGRQQTDRAIAEYRAELAIGPPRARILCDLGVALAVEGRLEEALAEFDEAIRIEPGFGDAHYDRALALEGLGRPDEAIAAYQRAIEIEPANVDALYHLGLALEAAGRASEAAAALRRVIGVKPDYPGAGEALREAEKSLALRGTG